MTTVILRILVNAAGLWVATRLVTGISIGGGPQESYALTLLVVAAVFGVVNAVIRPVVRLLALPLFILTLGLITFVINALMLVLTEWILQSSDLSFVVDGFTSALLGSVVVSIVSWVMSLVLPERR